MIALSLLAVYLPTLFLPYYFVDDVWLYRLPDRGMPDIVETLVFRQGRPVFAVLALLMQQLREWWGIESMLVARAFAVASLGAFAYLVYLFVGLWQSALTALCIATLLVTLPSFQMYVTAAPLFAPSLAYCGLVVLLFGRFVHRDRNTRRQQVVLVLATLGLVFVWATYQAIALVVVALLAPLLLSDWWQSNPRWLRLGGFVAGVGGSLVLYYALWLVGNQGIASDGRYSPAAVGLHVFENLPLYRTARIPQVFGFWDTSSRPGSYLALYLVVIAVAIAIDLYAARTKRFPRMLAWAAAAMAIVAVDLPLLFAPSSNTFSYMTSAPSAAAAFMLGAIATATIGRAVGTKVPLRNGAAQVGVFVLGAAAIGLSARNVLLNQVVPNWLEYALVRAEIRHHLSSQPISAITIFTRGSLGGQGRYEFSWSNFSAAFWVHWAVRDILDELGADSRIPIDVVATDGSHERVDSSAPELLAGSDRHVTIDLRTIDLSAPPGQMMRQPASLDGFQTFWTRRHSGKELPALMQRTPGTLKVLPIAGIHSTLVFTGVGARGERAAIDGDLTTWTADPAGFHRGTFMSVAVPSMADISGVRILSAPDYGIGAAGTLRVTCDQNQTFREAANLSLRPGTNVVNEVFWDPPCHTRVLNLEAVGKAAGSDFWIAEIEVLGTMVN